MTSIGLFLNLKADPCLWRPALKTKHALFQQSTATILPSSNKANPETNGSFSSPSAFLRSSVASSFNWTGCWVTWAEGWSLAQAWGCWTASFSGARSETSSSMGAESGTAINEIPIGYWLDMEIYVRVTHQNSYIYFHI